MKTKTAALVLAVLLIVTLFISWVGGATAQGTPTPWLPAPSGSLRQLPTATKPSFNLGQIMQNQPEAAVTQTPAPPAQDWQEISVTGRSTYTALMPTGWQLWIRSDYPDTGTAVQALLDLLGGIDATAAAQVEESSRAAMASWHAAAFAPQTANGRFISVVMLLADRAVVAQQLGLAATAQPAEIVQAFMLEPEDYNNMVAGFGVDSENAAPLVQNWGVYVPQNGGDLVVLLGEADESVYAEYEAAITGAVRSLVEGAAAPPTPPAEDAPTGQPTLPAATPTKPVAASATPTEPVPPSPTATLIPSPTPTTPTVLDPALEPRYSRVPQALSPANTSVSFPYTLTLPQVGGAVDASPIAPGCLGYTNVAPDIKFTAQDVVTLVSLLFWADAGDAVMIVYAPDGRWYCVDDIPGFVGYGHPGVDVPRANGEYAVWIATKSPGMTSGTLMIVVS